MQLMFSYTMRMFEKLEKNICGFCCFYGLAGVFKTVIFAWLHLSIMKIKNFPSSIPFSTSR